MPRLRNLVCQVEWNSPNHIPFQEFKTTYGDGFVQCYIAIPLGPTGFVIRLKSSGYIAPGLAMFVYIDGEYQCNRNRNKLLIPAEAVDQKDCEVDFRVRQKEYRGQDGTWKGKPWKFQKVTAAIDTGPNEDQQAVRAGEYGGMIEVLVLRCYHLHLSTTRAFSPSSVKTGGSSARDSYVDDQEVPFMTGAMFDGAGDTPLRNPAQRYQYQPITTSEPLRLRLRGGGKSEPSWSKTSDQQPVIASKMRGSRRRWQPSKVRDLRSNTTTNSLEDTSGSNVIQKSKANSTGSYTPDENWAGVRTVQTDEQWQTANTWDWQSHGNAETSNHGASSDNRIKENEWNDSGIDQATDEWNSTNIPDTHNQQDSEWNESNGNVINQDQSWGNPDLYGESHQDFVTNGNGQPQELTNAFSGDYQKPHQFQNLNSNKGRVSKAPSVASVKSALKSPSKMLSPTKFSPNDLATKLAALKPSLPGSWSPRIRARDQIARTESTKRRAADLNAERAKAVVSELDDKAPKDRSRLSKPATPLSVSTRHPILKAATSVSANAESKVHQSRPVRPSVTQPVTVDASEDDDRGRELRSPSSTEYTHKTGIPHYMDTITDPYARFIFQYREDAVISQMCGIDVIEPRAHLRDRLTSLTKEELIELLIEEREAANEPDEELTAKSPQDSTGYQPNLDAANNKLDEWGKANSNGEGNEQVNPNGSNGGGNDWTNSNSGGSGWGNSDSGRAASQGGSGGNGLDNQRGVNWNNFNDEPIGQVSWRGDNTQGHNNVESSWVGSTGGGDTVQW